MITVIGFGMIVLAFNQVVFLSTNQLGVDLGIGMLEAILVGVIGLMVSWAGLCTGSSPKTVARTHKGKATQNGWLSDNSASTTSYRKH